MWRLGVLGSVDAVGKMKFIPHCRGDHHGLELMYWKAWQLMYVAVMIILHSLPRSTNPQPKPPTTLLQRRKPPHIMRRTLIPPRILIQIQLMISLGIPPLPRLQNLRRDRFPLPPLLLHLPRHLPRLPLLLGRVVEDGGPVLRARVGALPVLRRRVMHLVEECEEIRV